MLARDPSYEKWLPLRTPEYHLPDTWEEVRYVWEPLNWVHEVLVVPPATSLLTTLRRQGEDLIPVSEHVVNPHYRASSSFDPAMPMKSVMPYKHYALTSTMRIATARMLRKRSHCCIQPASFMAACPMARGNQ